MKTDVLQDICTRLGTTVENLLPSLIEYGKYDCRLTAITWGLVLLVSMLMLGAGLYIGKKPDDSKPIKMTFAIVFILVGVILIFSSILVIIMAFYTLNEWNVFPEIMAYKYIISRI